MIYRNGPATTADSRGLPVDLVSVYTDLSNVETDEGRTLPTNCCLDQAASWPWRYIYAKDNVLSFTNYDLTEAPSNGEIRLNETGIRSLAIFWAYLSEQSDSVDLAYSLTSGSPIGVSFNVILDKFDTGLGEYVNETDFFDSASPTTDLSGTYTLSLPASTVPSRVIVSANALAGATMDYTLSFDVGAI